MINFCKKIFSTVDVIKCIYCSYLILGVIAFLVLLIMLISNVIFIYVSHNLTLCLKPSCIEYSIQLFGTPLKIIKAMALILPLFVFSVAYNNYKLSTENAQFSNRMNNERDFYSYLKDCSDTSKDWFKTINKKHLHASLFERGDRISLNEETFYQLTGFITFLNKLDSDFLIKPFDGELYKRNMFLTMQTLGLKIDEDIDIERLYSIEKEVLSFIDLTIELWFGIDIHYGKVKRKYAG